jgi:hypothetical protein
VRSGNFANQIGWQAASWKVDSWSVGKVLYTPRGLGEKLEGTKESGCLRLETYKEMLGGARGPD